MQHVDVDGFSREMCTEIKEPHRRHHPSCLRAIRQHKLIPLPSAGIRQAVDGFHGGEQDLLKKEGFCE